LIEAVAADTDRALLRSDAEQGVTPEVLERIADVARRDLARDPR
jgi:hypothetical protein